MTTESIFYYSLCTGKYKLFHESTEDGEKYYVNWDIKGDVADVPSYNITREITEKEYAYLLEKTLFK